MAEFKRGVVEEFIVDNITIPDYFNKYMYPQRRDYLTKLADITGSSTRCPFHQDVNPSMRYWRDKRMFNCFGCNASGDVINLARLHMQHTKGHKVSRKEAVDEICRLYNIRVERHTPAGHKVQAQDVTSTTVEEQQPFSQETGAVIEDKSIFEKCRESLNLRPQIIDNRKHFNFMTFQRSNSQLRDNPNTPLQERFKAYDDLDLSAQVAITWDKAISSAQNSLGLEDVNSAIFK